VLLVPGAKTSMGAMAVLFVGVAVAT